MLADHVYTDGPTGKCVIAGTFNSFRAQAFPLAVHAMAYASITDIRATSVSLELRLVDTKDLGVVVESTPVEVKTRNPQETAELAMPVPLYIPSPGHYDFELHIDGEKLGSIRLTAVLMMET